MQRRVFIIEAGKAFPAVAGALYLIGCGGSSPSSPSSTADITTVSSTSNAHTRSACRRRIK